MIHNHYHSKGGKVGTLFGVCAIICFVVALYVSVQSSGQGDELVGIWGLGAIFCAIAGLISCYFGFKEDEKFYLYAWIGSFLNGLMLVVMFCIFLIGV